MNRTPETRRARRRRPASLALAALATAATLAGATAPAASAAPSAIDVSASLGQCGRFAAQLVCRIDASWSAVAQAEYYAVRVSGPGGASADFGESGGTATTLWVPYAGDGTYTVHVTAWGTPAGEPKARLMASGEPDPGSVSDIAPQPEPAPAPEPAADPPPASQPALPEPPEPACEAAPAPAPQDPELVEQQALEGGATPEQAAALRAEAEAQVAAAAAAPACP